MLSAPEPVLKQHHTSPMKYQGARDISATLERLPTSSPELRKAAPVFVQIRLITANTC